MKLGQVRTGHWQGDYLKHSIPDSLYYLLSGCLTCFQCFLDIITPLRTIMDNSLHLSSALYVS